MKYCKSKTWFHKSLSVSPSTNTRASAEVITWRQSESQEAHRITHITDDRLKPLVFPHEETVFTTAQVLLSKTQDSLFRNCRARLHFFCSVLVFLQGLRGHAKKKKRRRRRKEVHFWHSTISVHKVFLFESMEPKSGVQRSDFLHKWVSHSRMEIKPPQNGKKSRLE